MFKNNLKNNSVTDNFNDSCDSNVNFFDTHHHQTCQNDSKKEL